MATMTACKKKEERPNIIKFDDENLFKTIVKMSEYWVQGLYEIPVVGHVIGRIYNYCVIRFAIKYG